jgi:carboxypeptidase C (cathepsin A)
MDFSAGAGGYPQTATKLQSAMAKNKYLKVLVMEGMYDLATPFYASAYTAQSAAKNPAIPAARPGFCVRRWRRCRL